MRGKEKKAISTGYLFIYLVFKVNPKGQE